VGWWSTSGSQNANATGLQPRDDVERLAAAAGQNRARARVYRDKIEREPSMRIFGDPFLGTSQHVRIGRRRGPSGQRPVGEISITRIRNCGNFHLGASGTGPARATSAETRRG